MKPSGIDWIGDIPESWKVKPLKYLAKCNQDVLLETTAPDYSFRYVDIGSVTYERGITEYQELRFEDSPSRARRRVSVGDTIISTVRTYLKAIAIISDSENVIVSTGFAVYTPDKAIYPQYLYYFCKSEGFVQEIDKNSYGIAYPAINTDLLSRICIAYPCYEEQQVISDFLDKECARIDSIAADLEKQIALLQQYKKSLITETVTKGLDKFVPMKDSGNPIIGSINYWYATKKLKYIVATPITDGPHETPVLVDDGIPFLSAESVKNGILDFEYKRGYISESDHKFFCKKIKPQKNDVFIVKSGATTGNVGIVTVDQEFSIWSPLALIRCDDKTVLQKFIYYCVSSNYFKHEIEQAWSYGTQQNIGMGVVENLTVVIPPVDEQKKIVHYLDDVLASMDKMIIDKTKQLEIIQQHKKSLIYEYVTGKKRVKEVR